LLEDVGRGGFGRLAFEREMHPLVAAVLLGCPGWIRSMSMPSRSHHTASLLRP
jgi:hypothetical protein